MAERKLWSGGESEECSKGVLRGRREELYADGREVMWMGGPWPRVCGLHLPPVRSNSDPGAGQGRGQHSLCLASGLVETVSLTLSAAWRERPGPQGPGPVATMSHVWIMARLEVWRLP